MSKLIGKILILRKKIFYQTRKIQGQVVLIPNEELLYFDISEDESYGRVALSILKSRLDKTIVKPTPPLPCSISEDEWKAKSEDDLDYDKYYEIIKKSSDEACEYDNKKREYEAIKECIEQEDIRLAPALLESRRFYPNEGYNIAPIYDQYSPTL